MWIIAIAAVIASVVFVIKTFQFHREEINAHELINGLENVLKRDGFVEAISLCDNTPGPVARVVGAAILAFSGAIKTSCRPWMPPVWKKSPGWNGM